MCRTARLPGRTHCDRRPLDSGPAAARDRQPRAPAGPHDRRVRASPWRAAVLRHRPPLVHPRSTPVRPFARLWLDARFSSTAHSGARQRPPRTSCGAVSRLPPSAVGEQDSSSRTATGGEREASGDGSAFPPPPAVPAVGWRQWSGVGSPVPPPAVPENGEVARQGRAGRRTATSGTCEQGDEGASDEEQELRPACARRMARRGRAGHGRLGATRPVTRITDRVEP